MRDELEVLEEWAGALLAKLEPGERRKLLGQVARDLRRNQQRRIAAQKAPDGTAYAPRKRGQLTAKRGRVKAQMFREMRGVRHMRTEHSGEAIAVGFMGRAARIARVHQRGLQDRPQRGQAQVRYASRALLGFTHQDLETFRQTFLEAMM